MSAGSERAERWGVSTRHQDAWGEWRTVPDETIAAVLDALGAGDADAPPADAGPLVVRAGAPVALDGDAVLRLEDGSERRAVGVLPADLPLGYHTLVAGSGWERQLIISPGRCHLPAGLRTWGWAAQLYAARSQQSWGIGDLGDLARLVRWSAGECGAGVVLVNPLHAGPATPPQEASPYFPSSRCFRSPLYICVDQVPGAAALGDRLDRLRRAARALNQSRVIDRDAVMRLKLEALGELFAGFRGDPGFDAYRAEHGDSLLAYATFCSLSESRGRPWQSWPPELRDPASPTVSAFRDSNSERIRFHQWLQWLLDGQLAAASGPLAVIHDLAVGVDPTGADAWRWQGCFAPGATVGAPPDAFNTRGQNWGLPPLNPWTLRAEGYRPYIETIRAGLRHAGGLRVDHVMGLFRLYWIPEGADPGFGAYVRYPAGDLLDILALESVRSGALVVGEDLGTVEPEARDELTARGMLSYRLLWFEQTEPAVWPRQVVAAVTTHDLPTVAGVWTGADLERQRELGLQPNEDGTIGIRERLRQWAGLPDGAGTGEAVTAAHRLLATAPSMLLAATLEDALGVVERPNLPGTTPESSPNWSLALPQTLEELEAAALARRIASLLRR